MRSPERRLIFIVACLLAVLLDSEFALARSQDAAKASDEIRRQLAKFQENDLLKVVLLDHSQKWGCLKGTESDGFRLDITGPPGEKVLYAEVSSVKRENRGGLKKVLRGVFGAATLGAVWFAVAKIGSNNPKTMAVKVPAGLAVSLAVVGSDARRKPTCR